MVVVFSMSPGILLFDHLHAKIHLSTPLLHMRDSPTVILYGPERFPMPFISFLMIILTLNIAM